MIVMPKASLAVGQQRANNLCKRFESQILIYEGEEINATFSAGISVFPLQGTTSNEIIRKADQSMHYAKKAGGNRVIYAE